MITLVFADDHAVTRAGIRTILNQAADIQILGEAENGLEAQELVERFPSYKVYKKTTLF